MATWAWLAICAAGVLVGAGVGWSLRRRRTAALSRGEIDRLQVRVAQLEDELGQSQRSAQEAEERAVAARTRGSVTNGGAGMVIDLRTDTPQPEPAPATATQDRAALTVVRDQPADVIDLRERSAPPVPTHNLQYLNELGPRADSLLRSVGITSLDQLVEADRDTLRRIDGTSSFSAKRARKKWIPQAEAMLDDAERHGRATSPDYRELRQVRGVGKTMARWLETRNITSLDDLAALDKAKVTALSEELTDFPGRIREQRWVKQARALTR